MKTFNEWSRLGYKIKKGSKATWVEGVAMFSKDQVRKRPPPTVHDYDMEFDYEQQVHYQINGW